MLQLRAGHEVNLSQAVIDAYSAVTPSRAWGRAPVVSESQQLQSLRTACISSGQSAQFLVYASAVSELAKLLSLPKTVFPWSNSLGVSRSRVNGCGLYFELLNVMYNAGAAAFNEEKYALAASVFKYIRTDVHPRVEKPPPELENVVVFSNLEDICTGLAIEAEHPWTAFQLIQAVLNSRTLLCSDALAPFLVPKVQEFGTRACFQYGEVNATSRRSRDRQLAKGALEKCIQLSPLSSYAEKAQEIIDTSEVGTRNSIKKLKSTVALFDPNEMKERHFSMEMLVPVFEFKKPVLFKTALPPNLIGVPYTLSLNLQIYIEREVLETKQRELQQEWIKAVESQTVHAPKSAVIDSAMNLVLTRAQSLEKQVLNQNFDQEQWLDRIRQVYKVLESSKSSGCECSGSSKLPDFTDVRKRAAEYDFYMKVYELYATNSEIQAGDINNFLSDACASVSAHSDESEDLTDKVGAFGQSQPFNFTFNTPNKGNQTPRKAGKAGKAGNPEQVECDCFSHLSSWFAICDCCCTISRLESLLTLLNAAEVAN